MSRENGHPAPRRSKNTDMIITLLPLLFMAVYYNGFRALSLAATGVVFSVIVDYICVRLSGRKRHKKHDWSAVVTAMIYVLLLPATAPYWLVFAGILIALLVAKHPFGGAGRNIFNPAAVAYAFAAICWPMRTLTYPAHHNWLPIFGDVFTSATERAPAYLLQLGGRPTIEPVDAILGNFTGPMGATSILVIAACGLYLIVRKTVPWEIPVATLAASSVFAALFPRVAAGHLASVMLETLAGVLLFGTVFMASDPATSPETRKGRVVYGVLLGLFTMLVRYFGKVEIGFVYALLLMNALAPACDVYAAAFVGKLRRYRVKDGDPDAEPLGTEVSVHD